MIVSNAAMKKALLYALAGFVFLVLQGMFLHRIHIWGVIPFLYPVLAAVPATFENPSFASVFALCLGMVCDLLLPEHFPCFYTLTFPLTGLAASLISKNLLPAALLCSYVVCVPAFALHGLFHCFLMMSSGHPAWKAGMFLCLREFAVTTPLLAPLIMIPFRLLANYLRREEARSTIFR